MSANVSVKLEGHYHAAKSEIVNYDGKIADKEKYVVVSHDMVYLGSSGKNVHVHCKTNHFGSVSRPKVSDYMLAELDFETGVYKVIEKRINNPCHPKYLQKKLALLVK